MSATSPLLQPHRHAADEAAAHGAHRRNGSSNGSSIIGINGSNTAKQTDYHEYHGNGVNGNGVGGAALPPSLSAVAADERLIRLIKIGLIFMGVICFALAAIVGLLAFEVTDPRSPIVALLSEVKYTKNLADSIGSVNLNMNKLNEEFGIVKQAIRTVVTNTYTMCDVVTLDTEKNKGCLGNNDTSSIVFG